MIRSTDMGNPVYVVSTTLYHAEGNSSAFIAAKSLEAAKAWVDEEMGPDGALTWVEHPNCWQWMALSPTQSSYDRPLYTISELNVIELVPE